jgi:hypothetical protein
VCRENLDPAEISPHLNEHEIRRMPTTQFERYRFIMGHFSVLTQAGFCRSRYSMTLLRDPLKRIFSAYTYWRTAPENNPVTSQAKVSSFADFVRYFVDSPAIVHNPYTHHFAAIGRDCPAYPADPTALLAAAKHNLAAYNFVGVCEELGLSVRLLCQELGWRPPDGIPHENRTSSEAWFGEITLETLDILRDLNGLDLELYEYAVQLLHARARMEAANCTAEPNRFVPFPIPYEMHRRAIVQSASATWPPDESSRMLGLGVDFMVTTPVAELSLGLQVNDAAGNIVWGTSTSRECLELQYERGCQSRAAFLVECDLPRGLYSVTVSLSEPRRLGFHEHWIDHATFFTVMPPRVARSPYVRGMRSQEFRSNVARNVDGQ